ncbi:MAG: hypothetical protein IPG45_24780 [Deltaproteobacteria bacterium]|nr:hypothetical protein [Deltaproteobacteria bacterium]MBK6687713.1 hypothetical protein [Deltaproteobacteria bacterium]
MTQSFDPDLAVWLNKVIPIRVLVLVKLKRWEGGEWRGDCRLCGQAGALFVHPRKNLWACNKGCGEHSTPIEWVVKDRGCDEGAALAFLVKLAQALGVPSIPEAPGPDRCSSGKESAQ